MIDLPVYKVEALRTAISKVLEKYAHMYRKRDGSEIRAMRLDGIKRELIDTGWRNVSRFDEFDLRDMGFPIMEAMYVGGVRPTGQYIQVVTNPA